MHPCAPRRRPLPDGGVNPPLGRVRVPVGAPLGRVPAPPPKPPVHEPLVGCRTVMLVAVSVVSVADPVVATAVTHSPAVIEETATATCWVNVVVGVQLTATWPSCWLCTCMVVPETAAIVPDAAGPRAPVPPVPFPAGDALAEGEGAALLEEDFDEPLLQALRVSASGDRDGRQCDDANRTGSSTRRNGRTDAAAEHEVPFLVVRTVGRGHGATRCGGRRWGTVGRPGRPDRPRSRRQWLWRPRWRSRSTARISRPDC